MGSKRVELFAAIRFDWQCNRMSIRSLARKWDVHRRTVRQAIALSVPPDRRSRCGRAGARGRGAGLVAFRADGQASGVRAVVALSERALVAMARSQWDRAEVLADQTRSVLRRAGIEESYATPLVSVVRARTAMHRADLPQYIKSSPALSGYGIC